MNQSTFDSFARRTANLVDRRSLFGGLSAALLTAGFVPLNAEAKKGGKGKKKSKACKKRVKKCRNEFLPDCESTDDPAECEDFVNNCCKKACDSFDKATDCLFD
jgi:hypothetical protein